MKIVGENDWLGTRPIFYHEKTGAASEDIHDVIDLGSLDFDPDGLRDYLDFGYCVFGRTPVRHVRFAGPCTRLVRDENQRLREERTTDPTEAWHGRTTSEHDVLEQLRASVQTWAQGVSGDIVLPLSGGFDSRLLGSMLPDPARVRAFSYGISDRPENSSETVIARQAAKHLGFSWQHIPLGNFHSFLDTWDRLFGPAVHAHGMYHFDFFTRVKNQLNAAPALLSGIVGDAWAGSITPKAVSSVADIAALGYTHGVDAGSLTCRITGDGQWRAKYWEEHQDKMRDPVFQCVEIIRLKMMLLRYLLRLPHSLQFRPWSPFTNSTLAMAMVCLPPDRRRDRAWQRDYFRTRELELSAPKASLQNSLDYRTLVRWPPPPLDSNRLGELFEPAAIEAINQAVCRPSLWQRGCGWMQTHPRGGRLTRRLGIENPMRTAYAAYVTIRPLDTLLARRDACG